MNKLHERKCLNKESGQETTRFFPVVSMCWHTPLIHVVTLTKSLRSPSRRGGDQATYNLLRAPTILGKLREKHLDHQDRLGDDNHQEKQAKAFTWARTDHQEQMHTSFSLLKSLILLLDWLNEQYVWMMKLKVALNNVWVYECSLVLRVCKMTHWRGIYRQLTRIEPLEKSCQKTA